MKKRTFFAMLILFLVFLNSMILIISLITLNDKLSAVREKCLTEHYVVASALIEDMEALGQREVDVRESIDGLVHPYSLYLQGREGELAVVYAGEWIYKSSESVLEDMLPEKESGGFQDIAGTQERVVYMKNMDSPSVCVYGNFPAPWQEYGLLYIGDASDTFSSWKHTKNLLFSLGAVAMLIMAVFLFKFLDLIFRPLKQISITSAQIANGDYGRRLPIKGKDEIAGMAFNFNRMAEQVEAQIQSLQDSANQKQQFIDNFAHELRIPLTAVYGYAEYIQKASISEEDRYECTEFIMSECKRLQNMAYQLLDLALLRKIEMEECAVDAILAQSEKMMLARAEEKKVKLSYVQRDVEDVAQQGGRGAVQRDVENAVQRNVDAARNAEMGCNSGHGQENFLVWGNEEQLLSLVNNLIDNAVKASPAESEVTVSVYPEKTDIIIEVRDNGIGMNEEQLTHIKEAFYRVDKARSRAAGGAGLGLSICERIARLHHAKLTFTSEPEKGTVARLSVPQPEKGKICDSSDTP